MGLSAAQRAAVRDIEVICSREADSRILRERVAARLSRLMYWDAACFGTTDPGTLLITDDVSYGVPRHGWAQAARNEYLVDDVNKFATLARSRTRVGILSRAPRELQESSPRLRSVLPAMDTRYEVRAACVAGGQCWGGVVLFRNGGQPDFSSADAAILHAVSAPLAAGLRRTACRPQAGLGVTAGTAGPGVLILGPGHEILTANDAARQWLDELAPAPDQSDGRLTCAVSGGRLPYVVHQVTARVHALRAGPGRADCGDWPAPAASAYARVRARSGRWATVHGSLVDGDLGPAPGTAIVIDAAPASDIAGVLMLAYELTRRERQVLQRVIAGAASNAIAAQLHISVNTVQDHLKSIFAKVGVRSRGQLVARLLEEHYLPETNGAL
jgi:DNA-binding CsgD family transcriptional regulator